MLSRFTMHATIIPFLNLCTSKILNCRSQSTGRLSDIAGVIDAFFQIGITKDMAKLKDIQAQGAEYSSFSDLPPYDLKDFDTSIALQELRFAGIADYAYEIINPRVSMLGDAAIAAFEVRQSGMLVDNKSFTGEHVSVRNRATFVLAKRPDWKIVHIHMSEMPGPKRVR